MIIKSLALCSQGLSPYFSPFVGALSRLCLLFPCRPLSASLATEAGIGPPLNRDGGEAPGAKPAASGDVSGDGVNPRLAVSRVSRPPGMRGCPDLACYSRASIGVFVIPDGVRIGGGHGFTLIDLGPETGQGLGLPQLRYLTGYGELTRATVFYAACSTKGRFVYICLTISPIGSNRLGAAKRNSI